MKTVKTIFAMCVMLFAVGTVYGSGAGGLKVNMNTNDAELTTVEISNLAVSAIEIDIRDAFGERLYSMKTEAPRSTLNKRYDFSQLEDGTYWYRVKVDKEATTKRLLVENGEITVVDIRKTIEPFYVMEDGMLKVTYMNPQLENIKLAVYDKNDQLVAEKHLGKAFAIHKAIDFSDVRFGAYDVVLVNEFDVFEHTVSVQ